MHTQAPLTTTKMIVGADVDVETLTGVIDSIDYGSFRLVIVESRAAAANESRGIVRDDMNHVLLDGIEVDTRDAMTALASLPVHLQRAELANAQREGRAPRDGLYLVQMVGPIRDEWITDLVGAGLEPISYVPQNAYIVRATGSATEALRELSTRLPYIQYVGDFHPGFRLSAALRSLAAQPVATTSAQLDLVVQVPEGPALDVALADLRQLATRWVQRYRVRDFHNIELVIDASRLAELAAKPYVLHVEERGERDLLDEVQGQIVAGNLAGNLPSGPGYLAWLADHGFDATQFGTFAVNVVDDVYQLTGAAAHPDLPSTRVWFEHNPSGMSGAQGGHGFLNAQILGGFNDSVGSPFTDSGGYSYGLGIAPFARVGVTAIFGSQAANATDWEAAAYANGARISSNQWTYPTIYRYDVTAQQADAIVRDARPSELGNQQLISVFAAGNSGIALGTINSPATAKNVITVGASENVRPSGIDGCAVGPSGADNANQVSSFSSRGPVNAVGGDGRFKPDLVAPGTHVQAGVPQSNYNGSSVCNMYFPTGQTLYGWSSGTSHASPAVAGGAALVYQHFLNSGMAPPSPAMAKAYLLNSATWMTDVGTSDSLPSNHQGMGRMDLGRAFDTIPRILVDETTTLGTTGAIYMKMGTVASTAKPFRVTLAWTDAPGPTTGAPWVNDLDLEVTVGGTTYRGNVFMGPTSTSGGVADNKNNVESVFLPAGVSGPFTVTVRATNIAGDGVPGNADVTDQDFALVVSNAIEKPATIDVSPASLAFFATAGGDSPAQQTLSITNSASVTSTFSASDDATWLTLSPTSATMPAGGTHAVSAAASIEGLAPGTYHATITIWSASSPVVIPVSLTVAPAPALAVSPASITFFATTGGANPASQTLSVAAAGGGTVDFVASVNASWLSVSPASATAPAALLLATNPGGLDVGTYAATVELSPINAALPRAYVPVTLVVESGDHVFNGDFELANQGWVFSGDAGVAVDFPAAGVRHARLLGGTTTSGALFQTIQIPATATRANLTYRLQVSTSETQPKANDKLYVELRDTAGASLATLAVHSNREAGAAYVQVGPIDLLSYRGAKLRLQFRASANKTKPTTFRIDDVSIQ